MSTVDQQNLSAAAKLLKEQAEARKASADADKATADATLAQAKARIGEVPASGFTGAAETGVGAGQAEAFLLGSVAVLQMAEEMAAALTAQPPRAFTTWMLCTAATVPDLQALQTFEVESQAFEQAMEEAAAASPHGDVQADAGFGGESSDARFRSFSVATVGLGIDAVTKLLGYLKSDYKFQGVDVASSDAMLLTALAGALCRQRASVSLPGMYQPPNTASSVPPAFTAPLHWAADARARMRSLTERQLRLQAQLDAQEHALTEAGMPEEREEIENGVRDLQALMPMYTAAIATWQALAERLDAWHSRLLTSEAGGTVPMAAVVRQAALRDALSGAAIVVVQLHKVAGSTYTQRSWLSSLFGPPFNVMGGAVGSLTAFDAASGELFASALVPVHSGYQEVLGVRRFINSNR